MRLILLFLTACTVLGFAAPHAPAAQYSALLVAASKKPGPNDPRLAPYEANLRKILRFESFRLIGEDHANVAGTGQGQLSLGDGHQLLLEAEGGHRVQATWKQGSRTLMNTALSLKPGVPAILGGPATGKEGEAYAVILIAK